MNKDLSKKDLYESVKSLVEIDETPHIHLDQHKLFTLFSIGFQYLLFKSTKNPGAYILRIEDSLLADKLSKRSKDSTTRKFLQSLLIPRKLKYQGSMFYLDFFHPGSWNITKDIEPSRIKGALVVKNTSEKPMHELDPDEENELDSLPKNYFYTPLQEICPKTVVIAYDNHFERTSALRFPFIKKDKENLAGVHISQEVEEKLDKD